MAASAALATVGVSGCATKGFVRAHVGEVRESVESVSSALDTTQSRVQANEAKIREVDRTAESAMRAANLAADEAGSAGRLVKTTEARTAAIEKDRLKLVYDVVMSEQESGFRFDSAALPEAAKEHIDDLIAKLKQNPTCAFITIEGYTDNIGSQTSTSGWGSSGRERSSATSTTSIRFRYTRWK